MDEKSGTNLQCPRIKLDNNRRRVSNVIEPLGRFKEVEFEYRILTE